MCEKCTEFDRNIGHYRDIASKITDEAMHRGIEVLIERAKARKADLHPEPPVRPPGLAGPERPLF